MSYSHDSIIKAAVANVEESMLHRDQKRRKRHHPLQGYCYVVAESLAFMAFWRSNYRPMRVKHEGQSHWFLQHQGDGHIVDPTAGQFRTNVPYAKAKRAGFLTNRPSNRASLLIEKMRKWLMYYGCMQHETYEIEALCRTTDDWKPSIPGGYCRVILTINHPFLRSTFNRVTVCGGPREDRTAIGRYKEFFGPEGAGTAFELFSEFQGMPFVNFKHLEDFGFLHR